MIACCFMKFMSNKQTCLQKHLIRDLLAFPTRLANEMMDSLGSLPDAQRDAIHATEEEVCQVSNIRVNPNCTGGAAS